MSSTDMICFSILVITIAATIAGMKVTAISTILSIEMFVGVGAATVSHKLSG
jgi:hypothetical protein